MDGLRPEGDRDPLSEPGDGAAITRRDHPARRWAAIAGVVLLVGGLALSTIRGSVPAGGSSTMQGMSMPGMQQVGVTFRDISGARVTVPGGKPGAVLFMASDGCPLCAQAARELADLAARRGAGVQLTLISLNTAETRSGLERFDRSVGGLKARYAIEDPGASLGTAFKVRQTGTILVYDRTGMVVGRVQWGAHQARRELVKALRSV